MRFSKATGWALALVLCLARAAQAGDPSLDWWTVESQHFVVHYHEPLEIVARRIATVAERAHAVMVPIFEWNPEEKTHIVVLDTTDSSNGFANVLPRNEIRLLVSAPPGDSALGDYDDWLYDLTTHEYSHILHLDSISGLPRFYNKIFGKTWSPNQVQPRWVIEGLATYLESKLSSAGRTRHALFDMNLRVATLSGEERRLDEASNGPLAWPHGNVAYLYGSHFLRYVFDRYGGDKVDDMSWYYGSQPIPFGLNRSIESVTDRTFVELYDEWREYRQAKYRMQLEAIERAGRREGRRLTFTGEVNFEPRYTRDGKQLVWMFGDGYSEGRLAAMPIGENQGQMGTYAVIERGSTFDFLSDGSLVIERTDTDRSYYSYQELFLWDRATGAATQLTRNRRAKDPAVSPDERMVAFTTNGGARRELVVMPIRPEAQPRVIWKGEHHFDQAFAPAWAPDGETIALSVWRYGGRRDIALVDVDTGETRYLQDDRAQDLAPEFSPDGRYLYYSSDRTGVYNIFAYDLEEERTYQVTNVLGCALNPAVSPDGTRLAYQGYDYDGYEIFEITVDRDSWTPAPDYIDDRPDPVVVDEGEAVVSKPRTYRPLETLAPQQYTLSAVANLTSGRVNRRINVQTSGNDVVGHHGYRLGATLGLDDGYQNLGGSYSYTRLWPGITLAASRRVSKRAGVRIDGVDTDFTEEALSLTTGARLPVLQRPRGTGTLSVTYDLDVLRNVDDEFEQYDPNALLPQYPETDLAIAGMTVTWSYGDTKGFTYAVGPQMGQSMSLSMRVNHQLVGSDVRTLNLGYRWDGYRQLPWVRDTTAFVRVSGGLRTTARERRQDFGLGGVPEQDIVLSIRDNLRAGISGYLRGYPARVVSGPQYHLANFELRRELINVERGIQTLPFYVRRLHVAGLADVGNAFEGAIDGRDFKWSVGASLRLDLLLGYFLPATFDIGYARGLSSEGTDEFWTLLTGTL